MPARKPAEPTDINPFRYGGPVVDETFCNRTEELQRMLANLRSKNSMWLHSPRRYGRTSLIREAFRRVSGEIGTAFVDVYPVRDRDSFAGAWLRGVSGLVGELTGGGQKALGMLRSLLTAVTPQLGLDDGGKPILSLSTRVPAGRAGLTVAEVLRLVEAAAEASSATAGRRVVIACDEFQQVAAVPGLEAEIRTELQTHEHTTYIFSGSQPSLLRDMFADSKRPFYAFGEHVPIDRISSADLHAFIAGRFATTGLSIAEAVITDVVSAANGHPHFAQYFAATAWDLRRAGQTDAEALIEGWRARVIGGLDPAFRMTFDDLSKSQRAVLVHLARHGSEALFATRTRYEHGLGSSSTMATALVALTRRDILQRHGGGDYRFTDPSFAMWLAGLG